MYSYLESTVVCIEPATVINVGENYVLEEPFCSSTPIKIKPSNVKNL